MEADEAGNDGEAQRDEGSGSDGSPVAAFERTWSNSSRRPGGPPFDFYERFRLLKGCFPETSCFGNPETPHATAAKSIAWRAGFGRVFGKGLIASTRQRRQPAGGLFGSEGDCNRTAMLEEYHLCHGESIRYSSHRSQTRKSELGTASSARSSSRH